MKEFHALTDAELDGMFQDVGTVHQDINKLIVAYSALRDHHIAETTALSKRDRSSIMRMAGNILGGMLAQPAFHDNYKDAVMMAVVLARDIIAAVDKEGPAR